MANGVLFLPLLLLEPQRAIVEAMMLRPSEPLLRRAPRGDGQPVLVLPGFTAGDGSTKILRNFLKRQGFEPHPWLLGQNMGPLGDKRERLAGRISELATRYREPISIVGWSLGGIYAREMAKEAPELIRQVISLGSPFAGAGRGRRTNSSLDRVNEEDALTRNREFVKALRTPPSVPCTAIYSRTDGIVHWKDCIEPETDHTESIEVVSSHCGLGMHPLVFYAIAERLSQKAGAWKPFDRSGWRRHAFGEAPSADQN
ncbi:MAG: pimeloyl-ACP methyl ester carboxylesterase [Myxococcota bacterium]